MDILTRNQVFGPEVSSAPGASQMPHPEKVALPDTSHYIEQLASAATDKRTLNAIFPKYNSYVKNPSVFDRTSKLFLPLKSLLGIDAAEPVKGSPVAAAGASSAGPRSVVAYAIYRTAGDAMPRLFEANLKQRYGVELTVPSTVLSVAVLDSGGRVRSSGVLDAPVKYRIRVDHVNQQANPQCVHWKADDGDGSRGGGAAWSREGCRTEFNDPWSYDREDFHVNCTCPSAGPVAVVMNREELMALTEPSLAEDVVTYVGLVASVVFLTAAFVCLSIIRGLQTNSNSIHRNFVICLLLAQLVFLLALKLRSAVHHHEVNFSIRCS